MLVDTHAHLESIDDLENVFLRARQSGINKIITVGTSIESSKKNIEIAEKYSTDDFKIYAICGIHPKDGRGDIERFGLYQCIDTLKQIAKSSKKVVGIGETGLDYRLTSDPSTSSGQAKQLTTDPTSSSQTRLQGASKEKKFQRTLFEAQIQLADDLKLPLIVHCRNAWEEIFDLLSKHNHYSSSDRIRLGSREVSTKDMILNGEFSTSSNNKLRGVFHSWTGDWNSAKRALDLGFYISFSGIVTFKNAKEIQEVAKKMPVEKMLVETDSPYLSPEPWRGKINEPKNVKIVAEFITILRSLSLDQIAQVTSENAERLFGFENL